MRKKSTTIIVYTVVVIMLALLLYYAYITYSRINTWSDKKRTFFVTDKELNKIERRHVFNEFNQDRVQAVKNYDARREFDKSKPSIELRPGRGRIGSHYLKPRPKIKDPENTENTETRSPFHDSKKNVVALTPNFNNEENGFLGGIVRTKKYKKSKFKKRR